MVSVSLSLVCLFVFASLHLVISSEEESTTTEEPLAEEFLQYQADDEKTFHCPSDQEAVRSCKPYTLFTYTTCCQHDHTRCCFHVKEWVWIAGGVLIAVVGAVALTCLARCIFRFKNKSQQSYDFA